MSCVDASRKSFGVDSGNVMPYCSLVRGGGPQG